MKIGLLIIATNKYIRFLENLISSADKYFLPNHEVEYFIFTDHSSIPVLSNRKINLIQTSHKDWPWMTLGRYKIFSEQEYLLNNFDYLYYCDADMKFCGFVEDEILSERVATIHPGFLGTRGTPETNPISLACVFPNENMTYFAGGFNGGSSKHYLEMSQKLALNIEKDYNNGIIALWHDESHFNRYMIDNPPTKILDAGYCYQEDAILPYKPRLIALNKNHSEIRS